MTDEQIKLIEENMDLVRIVLWTKFPGHLNRWDDLYQEGCIGLIKAAVSYNSIKGQFRTYAVRTIWGNIKHYIRDSFSVTHSRRVSEMRPMYLNYIGQNHDARGDEIMKALNLDLHAYLELNNFLATSLDEITEDISAYDFFKDAKAEMTFDEIETRDIFSRCINKLLSSKAYPQWHKDVYKLYLSSRLSDEFPLTQVQIGGLFNVTQMSVSRIIAKFNKALKEMLERHTIFV